MARLDPKESYEALKDGVKEAISKTFPHVGKVNTLELEGIDIPDELSSSDYAAQKQAKLNERTFGIPVQATMVLRENATGKVLDRSVVKIATLPKITDRYSYITAGTEYQVDNQWRLRPGVYTKVKQNGDLDSFFNIKGRPLHVGFDPKTRKFDFQIGGAAPPLYPLMKALGVSDDTLERQWGTDILAANRVDTRGKPHNLQRTVIDIAQRLDPRAEVGSYEQAASVMVLIKRAQLAGAVVVLGSATPSLESFHNVGLAKYTLLPLTERPTGQPLPTVSVIDLREHAAGTPDAALLSAPLRVAMHDTLARGEQVATVAWRQGMALVEALDESLAGAQRRHGIDIVEEQLVELAHPEEDQGVRLPRLHLEELLHHRRRAGGVIGLDGGRSGGVHDAMT